MSRQAAPVAPLVVQDGRSSRSSAVVAVGFLVSTGLSAALGLLIGIVLGETPETDALLAAYSLYLVFALFGANLRIALVPIIGSGADEQRLRQRGSDVVRRAGTVGAALAALVLVTAPLTGRLLTAGKDDARPGTATLCLAFLAIASFCQVVAASQGALLAAARRFAGSAAIYVASAGTTVVAAAALMPGFGAPGAAAGVLVGAVALLVGHQRLLARHGLRAHPSWGAARERDTWRLGLTAAQGAAVPLAAQLMLTVSLVMLTGAVGTVAAYTYGYFAAALLSSVTAASIGFATMPDLIADLERRPREAPRSYLLSVGPIGAFLYVPVAAATATFGRPLLDLLLASALGSDARDVLWNVLRIFLAAVFVWVLLAPVPTIALSQRRYAASAVIAAAVLGVHVVVLTALGLLHAGPAVIALAHGSISAATSLILAVLVFGRRAPSTLGRALVASAPAVAIALVFPLLDRLLPGGGVARSVGLSALGSLLYVATAYVLWPRVGRAVFRPVLTMRPRP